MAERSLLVDLYELTMAQCYFNYRKGVKATFDLFIRQLPPNRSYLVAAGLQDVLEHIKALKFERQDIGYLRSLGIFSADFLKYLEVFRFTGDMWAMPEGTIFFAGEPVIRVTAPLIEAQMIESFLLNTINLQAMIATKAHRVVVQAKGAKVYDFSFRRTHGPQAGIKVARSSYLAGFDGTATVAAGKLYGIPVVGTMAHSFVMSFKHEIDSFLAYSRTFPLRTTLLVDTYDLEKGIDNAVTAAQYLKERKNSLKAIRLDSGDLIYWSRRARKTFDRSGFNNVRIMASGNLDEYKIAQLIKKGAKIDGFGVGTHMGVSLDAPSLDVIYKISEVTDDEGNFLPTMKLSKAKLSYPGRKQVYRVIGKNGMFVKDILALEKEDAAGKPLLVKVVNKGKPVYKAPGLINSRNSLKKDFLKFPGHLAELRSARVYPVVISKGLEALRRSREAQLKRRQ